MAMYGFASGAMERTSMRAERHSGFGQGTIYHVRERHEVGAAGELRDHASKDAVDVLGEDGQAHHLAPVPFHGEDRCRGLVARGLDAEDQLSHRAPGGARSPFPASLEWTHRLVRG